MDRDPRIAYFSMEIALESDLPTYAGGLGVLAGDTLRSCADLGLPVVGITLVHRQGYFRQQFTPEGEQQELPDEWHPEERLERLDRRFEVSIAGQTVPLEAWQYTITGSRGHRVPVYLLDAAVAGSSPEQRALTGRLYGGDDRYRLSQEVILGVGGVRLLRALGYDSLERFHLNEGHAALAIPELVAERIAQSADPFEKARSSICSHCVFTTHTPVPAGHDVFSAELAREVLGEAVYAQVEALGESQGLNMTELALEHSLMVNGVAMRHGEVSRGLFPGYPIRSITNGIHPGTWAAPALADLYDRHLPEWRHDPFTLRYAIAIEPDEIGEAHHAAKADLLRVVAERCGRALDPDALTLGFARRATAYKRPMLVLRDVERLAAIAERVGPIQLVFGGKAHPADGEGRRLLRELHETAARLPSGVSAVVLPGYDMTLGRTLTAGCDVWLNTPVPPLEASGTSGMKAALNGVPSLSVLDGWWIEGCIEGVTGWAIGDDDGSTALDDSARETRDARDADALYEKLGDVVAPLFYQDLPEFRRIMQKSIALNASYFHTHRMALQYLFEAYGGAGGGRPRASSGGQGT